MLHNALGQLRAKNLGPGKHPDGQGLWLVKRKRDAGKWILRLAIAGKRREMGLGRWPDVSIAEARERAAGARKALRGGLDPIAEREKARFKPHRLNVTEAIGQCFEARKAVLKRDGDAGRWMSPLNTHVIPKLGKLAIEDVDQHVLRRALEPIWHDRPEAAAKALDRMGLTLKHAAALGLDVDLQATMKVRALLGKQRHIVTHIPSMPYSEAPAFYQWLQGQSGVTPLALRFLMLTVCRTSEVRLITAGEIENGVLTLSAERTKASREHRVPLADEAQRIVDQCRKLSPNEHLFPGHLGKPLSDMAMATLMRRAGFKARPHGFRATFRTWCEECTDASFEVKEAALGHLVDRGVVAAYQRSDRIDQRRAILAMWQSHLLGQPK